MTDDIVERLREWKAHHLGEIVSISPPAGFKVRLEAADEIERLRAENEKLRDMLLRSDKLTRQEWYDMRNTQLAEEANAAPLKETDNG